MHVQRTNPETLVVSQLPDGSMVLIDRVSQTVFALNATAGAAWDACRQPTTLADITDSMQRSLHPEVSEEIAREAVLQLEEQKLVHTWGRSLAATRRDFIATVGAIAIPLVISLPVAEQQAFAGTATSRPTAVPPPKVTPLPKPSATAS